METIFDQLNYLHSEKNRLFKKVRSCIIDIEINDINSEIETFYLKLQATLYSKDVKKTKKWGYPAKFIGNFEGLLSLLEQFSDLRKEGYSFKTMQDVYDQKNDRIVYGDDDDPHSDIAYALEVKMHNLGIMTFTYDKNTFDIDENLPCKNIITVYQKPNKTLRNKVSKRVKLL